MDILGEIAFKVRSDAIVNALTDFKLVVLLDALLASRFDATILCVVCFSQVVLLRCVVH